MTASSSSRPSTTSASSSCSSSSSSSSFPSASLCPLALSIMYQCLIREDIVCANAQSWFSALKECLHLALLVTAVAKLRGTKLLHRRHPASRLSNDADIVDGNVHSHRGIAVVRQTARRHDPFARSLPEGVNRAVHTIIMYLEEHITYTGDGVDGASRAVLRFATLLNN